MRGQLLSRAAVQVATGESHSVCVTEDGSVHTWGDNGEGQLGVANTTDGNVPIIVPTLQDLNVNINVIL